jgi:hypothetical protein
MSRKQTSELELYQPSDIYVDICATTEAMESNQESLLTPKLKQNAKISAVRFISHGTRLKPHLKPQSIELESKCARQFISHQLDSLLESSSINTLFWLSYLSMSSPKYSLFITKSIKLSSIAGESESQPLPHHPPPQVQVLLLSAYFQSSHVSGKTSQVRHPYLGALDAS